MPWMVRTWIGVSVSFVGAATSGLTSTLDAARPPPRAVPQTPGAGCGRHSYPGFDR